MWLERVSQTYSISLESEIRFVLDIGRSKGTRQDFKSVKYPFSFIQTTDRRDNRKKNGLKHEFINGSQQQQKKREKKRKTDT